MPYHRRSSFIPSNLSVPGQRNIDMANLSRDSPKAPAATSGSLLDIMRGLNLLKRSSTRSSSSKQVSSCRVPEAVSGSSLFLVLSAKCRRITKVCHERGKVLVLRCRCPGIGSVAFKHVPAKHAAVSALMIQAEAAASMDLPPHPLLVKPLLVHHSSDQGAFIVSQYGGTSLQQLLGTAWCDSRQDIRTRISKAGDMLACIALALEQLATLPVPRIHRDIKPGNIVFDSESGILRLIDFGTIIQADKGDFFTGFTFAYLEPAMAQSFGSGGFAVVTREGQAAATSAASDIWALSLVALEIVLARLPFELDYEGWCFGDHRKVEFLDALAAWDPWKSTDLSALAAVDQAAADLLRRGLAGDPAKRLNLQQLLQHPFVKGRVVKFRKVVAALLPSTQKQQQRIVSLFDGVLLVPAGGPSCGTAAAADRDEVLMPGTPPPAARRSANDMRDTASSSSSVSTAACEVAVVTSSSYSSSRCSSSTNSSTDSSHMRMPKGLAGTGISSSIASIGASDGADDAVGPWLLRQAPVDKPQPFGCFVGMLGARFPAKAAS